MNSDITALRESFWGPMETRAPTTKERRLKLFQLFERAKDAEHPNKFKYSLPKPVEALGYRSVERQLVCENFYFHCLGLNLHSQVRKVKSLVLRGL